ncbi:hypothetical protein SDC9_136967 [bioreactor metagenome]|uniref:Uncharacterized protein n=1 Tax=bioreactor metagenome TaxID=1076179 RepID=A0A645DMT9_9ZZZZ
MPVIGLIDFISIVFFGTFVLSANRKEILTSSDGTDNVWSVSYSITVRIRAGIIAPVITFCCVPDIVTCILNVLCVVERVAVEGVICSCCKPESEFGAI